MFGRGACRVITALPSVTNFRTCCAKVAMGKNSCYAVVRGRIPGLYRSWNDCAAQVLGFKGNLYMGFSNEREAQIWLTQHGVHQPRLAARKEVDEFSKGGEAQLPADIVSPRDAPLAAAEGANVTTDQEVNKEAGESAVSRVTPQPQQLAAAADLSVGRHLTDNHNRHGALVRLEFDGASKRNPGPAGFGVALYDEVSNAEVGRVWRYMGDSHTNNQAEYAGLIAGLQAALELGYDRVKVQGDSSLIINQVLGRWRVKNQGLAPYHKAALGLVRRFSEFDAKQVPRSMNAVADALANQAVSEWNEGTHDQEAWTLEGIRAGATSSTGIAAADGNEGQPPIKRARVGTDV